jgi:predicted RNase H-like HicB family nuclease
MSEPGDVLDDRALEVTMESRGALTGFLDLPDLGRIRLDFLITYESDAYYIRCLDLGVMSCGDTVEECKENIREAILIYLEDLPEGQSLYKPAPPRYWQMFYELRARDEKGKTPSLSQGARRMLQNLWRQSEQVALQYA